MTEKEKAEAYDKAIERANKSYGKIIAEEIFPELKESKDERIKKAIIEFFESEDDNTTYSLVRKKDIIAWLERQGEQAPLQTNERAWLYLVSDVLTWKDGIGQYLDDQRVQELAKKLCSKYAQKLYHPSNTGKNKPKSADKIEPRFKVGDWVVDNCGYVWKIEGRLNQFYILEGVEGGESRPTIDWVDKTFHLWTIEDAKDGDILSCKEEILLFKSYSVQGRISLYCWYNGQTNNFHSKEEIDISLNKRHKIFPATKEQRDTFMKAMNDAGYEWDVEKKELKKKC